jgi:hypothetical protein
MQENQTLTDITTDLDEHSTIAPPIFKPLAFDKTSLQRSAELKWINDNMTIGGRM